MAKYEIITDKLNNFFTNNKLNIADAKPTSGSYTKGDLVLASTPTADVYGWICTSTGSPGTWQVLKSAAELTKGDIEDELTGQISSHTHARLDMNDTRSVVNRAPKDIPKGFSPQFKGCANVDYPWGIEFTNLLEMKGWDDSTGGHAAQVSFAANTGNLPELSMRVGENDADEWGGWARFFHNKDTSIYVRNDATVDHGFGSDLKPCGFIGRFPGWGSNTLFINTYSDKGSQRASFDTVRVLGSKFEIAGDLHAGYAELGKARFGGDTYGTTNYIEGGNGDGAGFDRHNLIIRSWWGIGFRDNGDNCKIFMDTRAGDLRVRGALFTDNFVEIKGSKIYAQGDDPGAQGAGTIWIKTV